MIDTAVVNSRLWPKHADAHTLEKLGEDELDWKRNFSYGASNTESLSLSLKLHEQKDYRAPPPAAGQPLFVCMEQLQTPNTQETMAQLPLLSTIQQKNHSVEETTEIQSSEEEPLAYGYSKNGDWKELSIEDALVRLTVELPSSTEELIFVVQTCREERFLDHALRLHVHICCHGLEDYRLLGNYLVAMFVDCGSFYAAEMAFDRLLSQKEHSWTALIQGYVESSEMLHAFDLYGRMKTDSVSPSRYTFLSLLKACTKLKCLERGREIDTEITKNRLNDDLFVGNALLGMYAKCGALIEARHAFDKMPMQDVVSWNTLITGYAENGLSTQALRCLEEMQLKGVAPDSVTYLCSLKACGSIRALDTGRKVNMEIVKMGFERDHAYGNSLVDMYGKCGSLAEARRVFDELTNQDVVSWTALISGYADHALGEEALVCLKQMELEGVSSNAVTIVCSLKACASIGAADKGRNLHSETVKKGLERASCVGNTLLNMYARCGLLLDAHSVFYSSSARDVVSWSALIAGYAEHGLHEEALKHFEQMQLEGIAPNEYSWNAMILGVSELAKSEKAVILYLQMQERGNLPNSMTFASVLKALGNSGGIEEGKRIHAQVHRMGLEASEVILATALVDMYGKCGSMVEAKEMFDAMQNRDLVAWSTLIMGYVRQGEIQSVLHMYEQMREEDILPDEMTFLSILTMCSHAGLVDKGWKYFESLSKANVSSLTIKHLNCMVDLLGRAGRLEEAKLIFEGMPFEPDLATCCTMLRACRLWGNTELGRQAFDCAKRLDKMYQTAYVLMFNIYADAHMWEEAKKIEIMFARVQAREVQGRSWVEIGDSIRVFLGDKTCFEQEAAVCEKVKLLTDQCSEDSYCRIEDTFENGTSCERSERLAVVSGLLNSCKVSPVRVAKNLRVCEGCHAFLSFLSRMEHRTVIYRDANCYHTFKDGVCSCSVYSNRVMQRDE